MAPSGVRPHPLTFPLGVSLCVSALFSRERRCACGSDRLPFCGQIDAAIHAHKHTLGASKLRVHDGQCARPHVLLGHCAPRGDAPRVLLNHALTIPLPRLLCVFQLTCIPGVINYKDAKIQLLDLPGIIEGASKGLGRGRQVIGVARTSDLVIMMLDAGKADIQKELLTQELDAVGIRINRRRPDITIKHKKTGGVSITSVCGDLTHLDVHQVRNILHLYKLHNVDILVREDCTVDEFIDVVEGNRIYLRCLYVINSQ